MNIRPLSITLPLAILLLGASYAIYSYTSTGTDHCASACESWTSNILPSGMCTLQCVEKNRPDPSWIYFQYAGVFFLIISAIYLFSFLMLKVIRRD